MNQLPPYLVKALRGPSRRRRRPASLVRVYRRHLNPMRRAVLRWMRTLDDAVRYGIEQQMVLGREPVPEAAPSWPRWRPKADVEKAARYTGVQLADWGCVTTKGARRIGPHQVRIYGEAMGRAGLLAKVKTPWNVVNRHAVRWSARHVTPYMRDLVLETRQGIQRLITSGIRDGKSIAQVGREMRRLPTFAMNPRQADALIRYRGKLQGVQDRIAAALRRSGGNAAAAARDLRIKVPKAWVKRVKDGTFDIDRMVGREARKKVRYRAEMIARTETMRAVAEGTLDGYAEAGVERVRFLSSADACLECLGYDGHVYTRAEASGMIPVHPNCRCCWVPEVAVPKERLEETEWSPSMTEEQADIWAKDSVWKEPLYHGTSEANEAKIVMDGFLYSRQSLYGKGIYTTPDAAGAEKWSQGRVLKLRANVSKAMDVDFGDWSESGMKKIKKWADLQAAGGEAGRQAFLKAGYDAYSVKMPTGEVYRVVLDKKKLTVVK